MVPEILTHGGHYFNFERPEESVIDIEDIAHSLANLCRFSGHVQRFYSVAQHSVLVSELLPGPLKLAGLLHDAPEAYLGDVSAPLKTLLPDYRHIEDRVSAAVLGTFGLSYPLDPQVKVADMRALATEKRDLMPYSEVEWECIRGLEPHPKHIAGCSPIMAEMMFLEQFFALGGSRAGLKAEDL